MPKQHYTKTAPQKIIEQITKGCETLNGLYMGRFNPYKFVQASANQQRHPEAILETLRMVYRYRDKIKDVWPYADSICRIESKNFYKRDADRQHQVEKNEWLELVAALREVHSKRK